MGKMTRQSESNWFIWALSFFPGMGLVRLGKNRSGWGAATLVFLLLALFWFVPNLFTWFLLGATFIAQMAYAVALATRSALAHTSEAHTKERSGKLPERFADKKRIVDEVRASFSQILGSDEQLQAAIVGHKHDSSRLMFVGVTQQHLVIADCSAAGNPANARRIANDEIKWVNLYLGMARSSISIETEFGQKFGLDYPDKLNDQAKLILKEYPGTWTSNAAVDRLAEDQEKAEKREENWVVFVALGFFILSAILMIRLETASFFTSMELSGGIFFFIAGWPRFFKLVRDYERDREGKYRVISAVLAGLQPALYWMFSIVFFGLGAIELIMSLRGLG